MRLEIELRCILFPLNILDVSTTWLESNLWSIQLIGCALERHTPVYIMSHSWRCISEQKLSHAVEGIVLDKKEEILDKNLLQSAKDLRLGRRITFQQDNDPKHTAKAMQEWLWDKSLNVLECPSQSPDLNLIKHLWRDLKIAVQRQSPSNLTEHERICREEWKKVPKCRCAKLLASYLRRLKAVIVAKRASTK